MCSHKYGFMTFRELLAPYKVTAVTPVQDALQSSCTSCGASRLRHWPDTLVTASQVHSALARQTKRRASFSHLRQNNVAMFSGIFCEVHMSRSAVVEVSGSLPTCPTC